MSLVFTSLTVVTPLFLREAAYMNVFLHELAQFVQDRLRKTMSLKQQKVQLVTGNITGVDQVSLHGRILTQTTGAMFLRPAL